MTNQCEQAAEASDTLEGTRLRNHSSASIWSKKLSDRQKIIWMILLAILAGAAVILINHWLKGDFAVASLYEATQP